MRGLTTDMTLAEAAARQGNRAFAINSVRTLAMRQGFTTATQAAIGFKIVLRDMFTAVGFLNTAMSIMLSRFGTMIIIFGAITVIKKFNEAVRNTARETDTAFRKVSSIIISSTGQTEESFNVLNISMIKFANSMGVSIDKVSDTMFFLASAGRESAEVLAEFEAVQKLSIATSKDMEATLDDNKKLVEVFAGLMNIYGENIGKANVQSERANYLAGLLFEAFKTQQILISELAAGLSYGTNQAVAMNVSIEELIASIAILNTGMIKGSKAGTSYANALRDTARNSAKLKKLFDIDIGNLSEGFSLVETVVKRVNQEMEGQGITLDLLVRLMQIYNIRGARAIISLAVQYERLEELLERNKDAERDLAAAIDITTDSFKVQEQKGKNLKSTMRLMFDLMRTGARGTASELRDQNQALSSALGMLNAYIGVATTATFALHTVKDALNAVVKWVMIKTKVTKALGQEENIFIDVTKKVKEGIAGLNLIWGLLTGKLSEAEFQIRYQTEILGDNAIAIEETEIALDALIAGMKSYIETLDTSIALVDILNREIIFKPSLRNEDAEAFVRFLSHAADVGDELNDVLDELGKKARDEVIKGFIHARDIDELIGAAMDPDEFKRLIIENFRILDREVTGAISTTIEKMAGEVANVNNELQQEIMSEEVTNIEEQIKLKTEARNRTVKILRDGAVQIRQIQRKNIQEGIEDVREGNRQLLEEQKRASRLSRTFIGGIPAYEYLKSGQPITDIAEITIAPRISAETIGELERIRKDVIGKVQEEALREHQENLSIRLRQHQLTMEEIQGVEGRVSYSVVKFWAEAEGATERMTRIQKKRLINMVDEYDDQIRTIVEASFSIDRAIIQSSADRAILQIKNNEAVVTSLVNTLRLTGFLTEMAAEEIMKKMKEANNELVDQINNQVIAAVINLEATISREAAKMKEGLKRDVGASFDELKQKADNFSNVMKQAFFDTHAMYAEQASALREIASVIDGIATLTENEHKKALAKTLSTTLSTVAGIINIWSEYQKIVVSTAGTIADADRVLAASTNAAERASAGIAKAAAQSAKAAAAMRSTLGVIGLVLQAGIAIYSLFKDEEQQRNKLDQEFLDEQATRAISPDYGQARVVNNRITLNPVIQFLDISQLTEDVQRRIAMGLWDNLKEIEKTFG
jgi:hypothetical protein